MSRQLKADVFVGTAVCSLRCPVHEGCFWNDCNDNDDGSVFGWQEEGDDRPDSARTLRAESSRRPTSPVCVCVMSITCVCVCVSAA